MAEQYLEKIKLQKATITNIPLLSLESDEIIYEITEQGVYTGRLAVGTGGGPGTHNIFYCQFIQSDWNETDNTKLSFIKNKPILTISEQTVTSSDVITEAGGYGALYNWNVIQGTSSLTSSDDWVVPSKANWETLLTFAGGGSVAGGKLKEIGFLHWDSPNTGATNEYGFNALGAGQRQGVAPPEDFTNLKQYFLCWSSEFIPKTESDYAQGGLFVIEGMSASYGSDYVWFGASIRLCNPSITTEGETGIYVGNDGKEYHYKVIGGIAWLTKNLNETQYRDNSYISGYDGGTYTPISNEDWVTRGEAGEGLMCYYNDNEALGGDTNQTLADLIPTLSKQITESEDIHPVTTDNVKLYTKGVTDSFISKEGKFVKIIRGQVVGVYAPQLVFEYTSAATIPVGGNTIEFWNTQLNLPVNGTAFTDVVIVDNFVNLIGGANINLISPEALATGQTSGLVSIKDYTGCLVSLSDHCLTYESEDGTGFLYFRKIYSETIINVGNWAFYGANGVSGFTNEYEFYLPNVPQLGDSALFNEVFTGKQGPKIKLWVHPDALICNDGAHDADITYLTNVEINPAYNPFDEATYITKSDLTKDFQVLIAKDITPGIVQTYELILKAREKLNIDSLVVECDSGTLTGCQLLIGSTVVSLDSATTFTISTTQAELTAISNYAITAGNLVKLVTSTGYTGTPTTIKVQLNYSKA